MSYKLTITVTKDILERSKMCGVDGYVDEITESCAIALAVRDIFPTASVSSLFISPIQNLRHRIELPPAAIYFIGRFDRTPAYLRPLLPEFYFDIEVPDEIIDKINIDEIKEMLQGHPTLRLQEV